MLSKETRIQKKSFPSSSSKGKSFFVNQITLRVVPQETKNLSKISVIVSKKISKTAVGRNRIRRRVYGMLKEFLPTIKGGFFLIFYPKASVEKISSKELQNLLSTLLINSKLISSP